ncbi:MAG: hypothetical protein CSA33_08560 [Desulfobulbus propionicus]|nr:MAG: hypothetical protein CSA33_08560 [Desulfobulbus propionicus]
MLEQPLKTTKQFENGRSLRLRLAKWIEYYNLARGHSSLENKTPDEVYMKRSSTVGMPSRRTPPSGSGISTRFTGFGL